MRLVGMVMGVCLAAALATACGSNDAGDDTSDDVIGDSDAMRPPDAPVVTDDAAPQRCEPIAGTQLALRLIATASDQPVLVTSPPGDPRLFEVERLGAIRLIDRETGALQDPPFLDLREEAGGPVLATYREMGLLGLAFHPDYATNGRLFVYFTGFTVYRVNVLAEVHVDPTDPDHADAATLQELIVFRDPEVNHNGGMIGFDADGLLVVGTGDGGSGGDPWDNGQDTEVLLGKLLRIDVDATSGELPYAIPPGNPFVVGGGRPEILAYGLRNPWRWAFDRVTGDIYIGDVGQNRHEEIDVLSPAALPGANLGWDDREGSACYEPATGCETAGRIDPVLDIPHGPPARYCAVIGGEVYRGGCYPDLVGRYLFTDHCTGVVRSIRVEGGVATELTDHASATAVQPTSLHADADGELYLTTKDGGIYAVEVTPP